MKLELCCILNGEYNDSGDLRGGPCCGFKLCKPCTDKYTRTTSQMYEDRRCNYIADLHYKFDPTCPHLRDRDAWKLKNEPSTLLSS